MALDLNRYVEDMIFNVPPPDFAPVSRV